MSETTKAPDQTEQAGTITKNDRDGIVAMAKAILDAAHEASNGDLGAFLGFLVGARSIAEVLATSGTKAHAQLLANLCTKLCLDAAARIDAVEGERVRR